MFRFKYLVIFCFLLFSGFCFAQEGENSDIVEPPESELENPVEELKTDECGYGRPLVVAGMIGNTPFGWVERDMSREKSYISWGLGRVVLDKIASQLGIQYESTGYTSYKDAIRALRFGEIDVLLASYHTIKELGTGTKVAYPSYFKNVFVAYFKKGNEIDAKTFYDLEDKKGIVRREEMIYPLIYQQLPDRANVVQVSGAKRAFEMLLNGEADYLIGSPYSVEAELRRYKLLDDIVTAGGVLSEASLYFVFSLNSPCIKLMDKFSELIMKNDYSQVTLDGDIRQLIDYWGNRFRGNPGLLETEKSE